VSGDLADLGYLGARRVRIALQGHQPFAAAVKAVHDTLRALRDGMPPGKLTGVADAELMKRVTRDADYSRWAKEFLGE
jgi:carboxyvinyl-carboxyphosphonate phosphorylmutase